MFYFIKNEQSYCSSLNIKKSKIETKITNNKNNRNSINITIESISQQYQNIKYY